MSDPKRAVCGDFHVIKLDGLFHVVFRPDEDPEWFRIIASFFTYERAYSYCDIERCSVWTYIDSATGSVSADSHTGDEELAGLRSPPVAPIPEGWMASRDGCAEMVRNIMPDADAVVPPHPDQDFTEQPGDSEHPDAYHKRVHDDALAPMPANPPAPDQPEPKTDAPRIVEEALTDSQRKVLDYFNKAANGDRLVNATSRQIGEGAGVANCSAINLVEALAKKGLLQIIERGGPTTSGVFRVPNVIVANIGCKSCGGPRAPGSVSLCRACYEADQSYAREIARAADAR